MRRETRLYPFLYSAILTLSCASLCQAAAAAVTPDIAITPAALDFKYTVGNALPAAQTLQIKSTSSALTFTVSTTGPLPYSAQWLSVSANSATTAAAIGVYVNPTGLPGGNYTGTININSPGAATPLHSVTVTLEVANAPATLSASTSSLTFNYVTGTAAPPSQPVQILTSGGALTVSLAITGGAWLKASPTGSISLVGLAGTVNVMVNPAGLAP